MGFEKDKSAGRISTRHSAKTIQIHAKSAVQHAHSKHNLRSVRAPPARALANTEAQANTRTPATRRHKTNTDSSRGKFFRCGNDPSAGSPTETLLRLHLPLNGEVRKSFYESARNKANRLTVPISHRVIQSVGATGGVYKGQGRNQCKLMTCVY
jgi:hypothetical protein